MIHCIDVYKAYANSGALGKATTALRGATLAFESPGFFGIMGASGSGKSTLLHLLAALDRPDSGEIWVAGKRIDQLPERDLTRFRQREVGIVFQQFNLIPTMTAQQNIELPGILAGEPASWLTKRSVELMDSLNLTSRATHRPEAMSGGEQQRVAIARALLFSPAVLLADEPTGNLDSATSEILWTLLEDLARERKMTIVMVTHEPAAATHCERVEILHDGRISGHISTKGMNASSVAAEYQRLGRTA